MVANENFLFCQDEFRFAYNWISKQMKSRIGKPSKDIKYPVWAWYQWEGKRKRRDQRLSGYAERGTPLVQIAFEADDTTFLLSDFDDWHIVLGNQYVAKNEYDWEQFHINNPTPTQKDLEPSWERIFDLNHHTNNKGLPFEEKSVQATLWEIHISQVKEVNHFIAK